MAEERRLKADNISTMADVAESELNAYAKGTRVRESMKTSLC